MAIVLASFFVGAIFGFGLSISEMVNPARVVGFLDITGLWDPTLLFVMAGALAVTFVGFPMILRRGHPLLRGQFGLPTKTRLDGPLIIGAAIFGIGWGIGGFCPGPALAALASGSINILLFAAAMIAGQWLGWAVEKRS
jgi:uncharacterized protein